MNKSNSASKIKMKSFDDLFGTNENLEQANANGGEIREIPLASLHTFRNHPFQIHEDKLEEMVESVRQYGVLVPGIARMRPQGGYEIIAGHTRKAACELAGLDTMPMFIRKLPLSWWTVTFREKISFQAKRQGRIVCVTMP